MLSSFFWGYVFTQVPAGYLSSRIGGKRLLFWSILGCGILTLFTPLSIRIGGWPVRKNDQNNNKNYKTKETEKRTHTHTCVMTPNAFNNFVFLSRFLIKFIF